MNRSENIIDLAIALVKAQAAMTAVGKANTARIETKAGGSFAYSYADLGAIFDMLRKPLSDNGLAILQTPAVTERSVEIETTLLHTSGQWVSCAVVMPIGTLDPKSIGSAITYGRRYGLCLVGAVTDEDDDGEAAGQQKKSQARSTQPTVPARPAVAPSATSGDHPGGNSAPEVTPTATGHASAAESDAEFDKLKSVHDEPPPATAKNGPGARLPGVTGVPDWPLRCNTFSQAHKQYRLKGSEMPDFPHILGAVGKLSIDGNAVTTVTSANVEEVFRLLEQRTLSAEADAAMKSG